MMPGSLWRILNNAYLLRLLYILVEEYEAFVQVVGIITIIYFGYILWNFCQLTASK